MGELLVGHMQFDGGSRGNPGPAAAAAIIVLDDGTSQSRGEYIGHETNNVAEYKALIVGIKLAQELGVKVIDIKGDSKLVVNHINGLWECKSPDLQPLMKKARGLLNGFFVDWNISHVPRAQNQFADAICNQTLDTVERAHRLGFRRKRNVVLS